MRTKDFRAAVKAAGPDDGLGAGQVRMIVSVFSNVDSQGDVVMPGAFDETLDAWKSSGDPIPFIWSHQWSDPFSHIGVITDAKATDIGLEVTAQLDLDEPKAKQVFSLLKSRRVTQASFGYEIDEGGWVEREADDGGKYEVYELRKLSLIECGPCLVGANQETELLEAKARQITAAVKHGRSLDATAAEALVKARDAIDEALKTPGATGAGQVDEKSAETDTTGQLDARTASDSPDDGQDESPAQLPSSKSAQARARLLLNTIPTEGD